MHYFFKSFSLLPGIDQTNWKLSKMIKEEFNKIVNFMTPGVGVLVLGRGHISHRVKMHYFFKNLLYSQAWIKQTMYKVMGQPNF